MKKNGHIIWRVFIIWGSEDNFINSKIFRNILIISSTNMHSFGVLFKLLFDQKNVKKHPVSHYQGKK